MFKLDVQIDPAITQRLEKLKSEFPAEVGTALQNEAARVAAAAIARAPRDQGELAGSAYVSQPNGSSSQPAVELGFGAPYALYMEERTDLHHPGGGEAKFLQRSLDASTSETLERLAGDLRPAFERGQSVTAASTLPTTPSVGSPSHHSSRRSRLAQQIRRRR